MRHRRILPGGLLAISLAFGLGCAGEASDDRTEAAPWVVSADRAREIPRLFAPYWADPPEGLAIRGAEVARTEVRIALEVRGVEGTLVLYREDGGAAPPGMGAVRVSCPDCDADGLARLDRLARHVEARQDEEGIALWHQPASQRRRPVQPVEAPPLSQAEAPLRSPGEPVVRAALAVALLAAFGWRLVSRRRRDGWAHPLDAGPARIQAVDYLLILAVGLFAVLPILFLPFVDNTAIFRAQRALEWPVGDVGHPFLFYLVIAPFAAISVEPWVVRLPLAACFLVQALLLAKASAAVGGRTAGLLVGLWFVLEARRRGGVFDVSSWDVAGVFLAGLLSWLAIHGSRLRAGEVPPGWRFWILPFVLMLGGLSSSRLFVVPACVLVLLLGIEVMRRRVPAWPVGLMTLVVGAAIVRTTTIFVDFVADPPLYSDLLRDLYLETPLARTPWMALPLALALGWVIVDARRIATRFAALTWAGVLAAVLVAGLTRDQAGYYLGLVTGLSLHLAAVGTAWAIRRLRARGTGTDLAVLAAASALLLATSAMPAGRPFQDRAGIEHFPHFVQGLEDDAVIYTPILGLERQMATERMRMDRRLRFREAEAAAARQLRDLDLETCANAPEAPAVSEGAYVVLRGFREHPCRVRIEARCTALFPLSGEFDYFVCGAQR